MGIFRLIRNLATSQPSMLLTNILLTHHCTQNCLQCSIPQQPTESEFMKFTDFQLITKRLKNQGTIGITLSGGEPLLHPEFEKIADWAHEMKFTRVHILTTLYYNDDVFQKLLRVISKYRFSVSCSFDGFGNTADYLRGGKNVAEKVECNMRKLDAYLTAKGLQRRTGINVVTSQKNISEIPRIIKLAEELNWRASVDIYRWRSGNQEEREELKIKNLDELDSVVKKCIASKAVWTPAWLLKGYRDYLENKHPKLCPYLLSPAIGSKFFINPDGDVSVCFGKPVGNILKQLPADIFASQNWQNKLAEFRSCPGCWNSCYTMSIGILRHSIFSIFIKKNSEK